MSESEEDPKAIERITRQSLGANNSLVDDVSSKRKSPSIEEALDTLSSVDNNTLVRANINIHLAVDTTVSHSMEFGLEPLQLQALMKIIIKRDSKLTLTLKSKLIKCLIPSSSVPEESVVKAICFISQRIFISPGPSKLESLLLRWILLVMDYLDGHSKLHKLYGVIFNFIHSEKLLIHACPLLFLLTRKDDVKLFRVEQLTDIMKKLGPEPAIIGLLTCYKVFKPNLVAVRLRCSHKTFFKASDNLWRATITSIIQKNNVHEQSNERIWESEKNQQRLQMQPAKRQKKMMIPKVHSASREHEQESEVNVITNVNGSPEVPFDQVDSFVHFLQVIENIQCPSQMASSLKDSRLQLFLSCNPDQVAMTRLCLWIQHYFVFGFDKTQREGQAQEEKNNSLLKLLCQFSENVQSLPVVHGFLEDFLPYWDGHSYTPVLFSLITCIQPCSYEEIQSSILQPLFRLFFSSDIYFKVMCVSTLTKLIKNFVIHMFSIQSGDTSANHESKRAEPEDSDTSGNYDLTQEIPRNQEEMLVYQDCIQQMMKYLDVVVVVAMRMEKDHILLQHVTLDLLEMISNVYKIYKVPVLCLPISIIYRLLLSDCPGTIARLCGVINLFRDNLTTLRTMVSSLTGDVPNELKALPLSTVSVACLDATINSMDPDVFNCLLVDVLKMLWHGTIFNASKSLQYESVFNIPLPQSLDGQTNGKCLSLYKGPAFAGLTFKFLKEIEFQRGTIQPSVIENFKELYLEYLERENFPQFKEFVNLNLKSRQIRTRISLSSVERMSSSGNELRPPVV